MLAASAPLDPEQPSPLNSELDSWVREMSGKLQVPERALIGYANAELTLRAEQPECQLSWVTLAGIGKAASDHGQVAGGELRADGFADRPIDTVPVDVAGGESDSVAPAVGPMQLSDELWQRWQESAQPGRQANAQNIDDAALTAGRALCGDGTDTSNGDQWWQAVEDYRGSELFLQRVLANANLYATLASDEHSPDPRAVRAIQFAIGQLGLPYVWGGNGPEGGHSGFDCSGLTTEAYKRAGIQLPRTAHWQYGDVTLIAEGEQPQLGDLVFYGNPATKIHHVGMYLGNNLMINAPTFGQAVQIHNYRSPGDEYAGAGRPAN